MARNNGQLPATENSGEHISSGEGPVVSAFNRPEAAEIKRNSEKFPTNAETFAAEAALALSEKMGEKWGISSPELLYKVASDYQAKHQNFNLETVMLSYSELRKLNIPTELVNFDQMDEAYESAEKLLDKAKDEKTKAATFRGYMNTHCTRIPMEQWSPRFGKWFAGGERALDDPGLEVVITTLSGKEKRAVAPSPEESKVLENEPLREQESLSLAEALVTLGKAANKITPAVESADTSLEALATVNKAVELSQAVLEAFKDEDVETAAILSNVWGKVSTGQALTPQDLSRVNSLYMAGRCPLRDKLLLSLMFSSSGS